MKGAFIMSLIDTIISKALEFEGVSESPPGSNNVIFNTDYYGEEVEGEAYPWCVTFCGMSSGCVMPPLYFAMVKRPHLQNLFILITTMGACFHRDRQAILS